MPGTQIAMKQESDDMGYYQWQSTKHIALAAGPTVFGELESLFGGEGFVYSGREFHEVTLDYKEAKRMEKLFMPHVNPLEHAELALPGPLARQTQTSSHRDRDKQAIVLFGRLTEFEENNLGRGYPPKLSWCQETMARMMGFAHWHEAQIRCAPELE